MDARDFARNVAGETIDRAKRLLPVSGWDPASVVGFNRVERIATVVMDEDTPLGSETTEAASLIGELAPGQRVMIARLPPSGVFVVGEITAQPERAFDPQLLERNPATPEGVSGGPLMGNGSTFGRYRLDGDRCFGRMQWIWGTSGVVNGGAVSWCVRLPVPLTSDYPPGGNMVVGHGWLYNGSGDPALGVHLVTVDAPIDNGDTEFAFIRVEHSSAVNQAGAVVSSGIIGSTTPRGAGLVPPWAAGVAKLTITLDGYPVE
jgi:hypothetical protein